jgi:phosphoglycolate phosphatase
MFKSIGYSDYEESRLKEFVGPAVKKHLISAYGFSQRQADEAYPFYREYLLNKGIYENRLYDGIVEALTSIRQAGKPVYLATSKPEQQALIVLEHFGIRHLFSDVFAARHEQGIFEKSEVLGLAIKALGKPERPVMVGDRCYDVLGGRHAGFDTVGVLYGYGDLKELTQAGCDYTVDTTADLAVLLGRGL